MEPNVLAEVDNQTGSIPACAGEPCIDDRHGLVSSLSGLSPRVRGSLDPDGVARVYPRVCGGATLMATQSRLGVYPRVCGGACAQFRPKYLGERVYPRVCGGSLARLDGSRGSIPACAGEPLQQA